MDPDSKTCYYYYYILSNTLINRYIAKTSTVLYVSAGEAINLASSINHNHEFSIVKKIFWRELWKIQTEAQNTDLIQTNFRDFSKKVCITDRV